MGKEAFEQLLGFHAAPTFVGVKVASLLSFRKSKFEDFDALLASYLPCFTCKGISVFRVTEGEEYVLLLFFREAELFAHLQKEGAQKILRACGYYLGSDVKEMLRFLSTRMWMKKSFPHEIGLFLGYPPEDVQGFMENNGKNFAYSGYWKVYANEAEVRQLFHLYSLCTHEFCRQLDAGKEFSELLRAV